MSETLVVTTNLDIVESVRTQRWRSVDEHVVAGGGGVLLGSSATVINVLVRYGIY